MRDAQNRLGARFGTCVHASAYMHCSRSSRATLSATSATFSNDFAPPAVVVDVLAAVLFVRGGAAVSA